MRSEVSCTAFIGILTSSHNSNQDPWNGHNLSIYLNTVIK